MASSATFASCAILCRRGNGTLPDVVWIAPAGSYSEHPPALVSRGQAYVTGVINALIAKPGLEEHGDFSKLGRLGRFYDHVVRRTSTRTAMGFGLPES